MTEKASKEKTKKTKKKKKTSKVKQPPKDKELEEVQNMDLGEKKGFFTEDEVNFIKQNYAFLTDRQLAKKLNRDMIAVRQKRIRLGLNNKQTVKKSLNRKNFQSYVNTLDDDEKEKVYRQEVRKSPWYKKIKRVLSREDLQLYEDKYVLFLLDPTVETMTVAERDALHQLTLAQIRSLNFLEEEREAKKRGDFNFSRAREISECDAVVERCQKSLNAQRVQRLKNQSDQEISFTRMIQEMKNPKIRREVGYQAAMLKFIAEKYYNDHIGIDVDSPNTNIMTGQFDEPFDLNIVFKGETVPSGLSSDFFEKYEGE